MALKPKHLHILFVDDDQDLLESAGEVLTGLGHVVRGETTSLNGLQAFSDNPADFDLAIVDPTMEGISGLDLAQRFRRIQRGLPVILYGGNIDPSLLHDAEGAGIYCCQKPSTGRELSRAITDALKR